ncbi:MAG: hypothetical protein ACON30_04735 [Flavobacteriaceae bacterium]
MKKLVFLILFILSFGCKNNSEQLSTIKGSYIFFEDAAVLQTKDEIYGVYMNEKTLELNEKAKALKAKTSEIIYVELKGNISTEEDEKIKWEKKFDIVEIISVSQKKQAKNTLILGTK